MIKKLPALLFSAVFLFIALSLFPTGKTKAQSSNSNNSISFGVASNLIVSDPNVKDGDIISSDDKGFFVTKLSYDTTMVGVMSSKPAVAIDTDGQTDKEKHPVVSSGKAFVNVSTSNGPIKKGDFITSSNTPGIGMKSTISGYVVGTALEDFTSSDKKEVKKINVLINVHYQTVKATVKTSMLDVLNFSKILVLENPIVAFKYLLSAAIIITAFVFGFNSFGKVARNGVEALGRNPMAAKTIQVGILFNSAVTISIIASGVIIAIFILKL